MTEGARKSTPRLPPWAPLAMVAALALAATATGLGNGFAYDDVPLVLRNDRVHDLAGILHRFVETYWPWIPLGPEGRLYRPLTTAGFTLQWALGGGSPGLFHLVSLGLYLLVALLVYALARRLLPAGPAALAGAVFAVHPVHTEVTGNVVGQGELLAAAWGVLAMTLACDGARVGWTPRRTAATVAAFTLALLSKEHALVLLALAPAVVLAAGGRAAVRSEATGRLLLLLLGVTILYLSLRVALLGSLAGDLPNPFWRDVGTRERVLTVLSGLPTVAGLLFWPAHLQADYAPREVLLVTAATPAVALGAAMVLGLAAACWLGRRHPAVWLGGLWLAITLLPASNLLFPSGVVLAERTLFLPSVGVVLLLGGVWAELRQGKRQVILFGACAWAVVLAGVVRSAARLPVWRNNQVLYAATIRDAPESYWAWRNYAGDLVLQDRPEEARAAYARSLGLFDRDPTVFDDAAGLERREGRCDRSLPLLDRALALDPERHQTAARLIGCLVTLGAFDSARAVARERMARGHEEFRSLLSLVDSADRARHLGVPPARPPQ